MAKGVADSGGDEPAPFELGLLGGSPGEERIDVRTDLRITPELTLGGSKLREPPVGVEDGVDETNSLQAKRVLADGGLPVLAPCVAEAADLDGRRPALARLLGGALGRQALEER
ncbi:MAG TPA: hypothetical protein VK762_17980, partial [Polyangiaceae bacterium]|nr:hypothetical protein [Polyangiaceae bacterium]